MIFSEGYMALLRVKKIAAEAAINLFCETNLIYCANLKRLGNSGNAHGEKIA